MTKSDGSISKIPCILGFDAEWVRKDEKKNRILSYQWFFIGPDDSRGGGVILVEDDQRLSMKKFIERALTEAKKSKLFVNYPKELTLVAHFSLADISVFKDFKILKRKFISVRRTYVSLEPHKINYADESRHSRSVSILLRDSVLLAPAKTRLEDLGEMHGLKKIRLPEGMIEQMDQLLEKHPELFKQYALRDAEIPAIHAREIARENQELTGKLKVPVSLGQVAVDFSLRLWRGRQAKLDALGKEVVKEVVYEPGNERYISKEKEVFKERVDLFEPFATESYHGGRNESFYFGATPESDWIDVDLVGAYPTALAHLPHLKWDCLEQVGDPDEFTHESVGMGLIHFKFPPGFRYPGLPVRQPNNLIFPMSGKTFCTAPEIALAREQGAEIDLVAGVLVPKDTQKNGSPYLEIVRQASDLRAEAREARQDVKEKLYKELINSFYGKFAQGLRKKRVFNATRDSMEDLQPSKVTQPYVAAMVTGIVRAALSEVMNKIDKRYMILSVTTDGFITNAPWEAVKSYTDGQMCKLLKQSRKGITGEAEPHILEVKHRARQLLSWRTRGQATLRKQKDDDLILAKSGVKAPSRCSSKAEQNDWIIQQFRDRTANSKIRYESLSTLRELYDDDEQDLVMTEKEQKLGMEFDFKRRVDPHEITTAPILGDDHVAFQTLPWQSVVEYKAFREFANAKSSKGSLCLKGVEDVRNLIMAQEQKISMIPGERLKSGDNSLNTAARYLVKAMVHSKFGCSLEFDGERRTYQWWCVQLNNYHDKKIRVTLDQFKKASGHTPPEPHGVALNTSTLVILAFAERHFPEFDRNDFFSDRRGNAARFREFDKSDRNRRRNEVEPPQS